MSSPSYSSSNLQLVVVVAPDWSAVDGTLYRFERTQSTHWNLIAPSIPVTLGKNGMAWGRGVFDLSHEIEVHKKEGDDKSPAGLFLLGPAFGDQEHQPYATNVPFELITEDLECVDDPHSAYYNQLVNRSAFINPDWTSSEKMYEIGALYALGIFIQHNLAPVKAGRGSAIFMHVWRGKGNGTAGCTAMDLYHLKGIVSWLDIKQKPGLVQLPLHEYMKKKSEWGLPDLLI